MQAQAENIITIEFDAEALQTLREIAKRRGWSDVTAYLRRLIADDLHTHDEYDNDTPFFFENSDLEVAESFKRGLLQAIRGEGRPIREVLAELDAEDEELRNPNETFHVSSYNTILK
jgi:hypothetical protein